MVGSVLITLLQIFLRVCLCERTLKLWKYTLTLTLLTLTLSLNCYVRNSVFFFFLFITFILYVLLVRFLYIICIYIMYIMTKTCCLPFSIHGVYMQIWLMSRKSKAVSRKSKTTSFGHNIIIYFQSFKDMILYTSKNAAVAAAGTRSSTSKNFQSTCYMSFLSRRDMIMSPS